MCVLTAGMLEAGLKAILAEYVSRNANRAVVRQYRRISERRPLNPNANEIVEILRHFDPVWALEIDEFLSKKDGALVDSVMNNRNQIAHGGQVGLSPATMREQFEGVVRVVEYTHRLVLRQD